MTSCSSAVPDSGFTDQAVRLGNHVCADILKGAAVLVPSIAGIKDFRRSQGRRAALPMECRPR